MNQDNKTNRMQELVELLNRAGKAYYQDAEEMMSDYQYETLYDELKELEQELGVVQLEEAASAVEEEDEVQHRTVLVQV